MSLERTIDQVKVLKVTETVALQLSRSVLQKSYSEKLLRIQSKTSVLDSCEHL